MQRMKAAEAERRKAGPVGNAVSDDYLASLSRQTTTKTAGEESAVFLVDAAAGAGAGVLSPAGLTDALHWRYATKTFDPTGVIPADTWTALEESLRLAPSSYGLQVSTAEISDST